MGKRIYVFWAIYLFVALIFLIGIVVYEAYVNRNWSILAFIPFIIVLWMLNLELLAIEMSYHGH
jgi:hypothetical protein